MCALLSGLYIGANHERKVQPKKEKNVSLNTYHRHVGNNMHHTKWDFNTDNATDLLSLHTASCHYKAFFMVFDLLNCCMQAVLKSEIEFHMSH